jgi:antitoxin (DNA-binding transcriptional repressor) of toxin-antitoxin stability system
MMPTIPIENANGSLADFVEKLSPGEEVVLTKGGEPIAVIRAASPRSAGPRKLGSQQGSILYIAPDFDDIPEGFEDYLP